MDGTTLQSAAFDYQPNHTHVELYAVLGVSLGAVVLLLTLTWNILTYKARPYQYNGTRQGVVPALIQDKQDLNDALKEYDGATTTDTTVNQGLDQNAQDAAQFSQ